MCSHFKEHVCCMEKADRYKDLLEGIMITAGTVVQFCHFKLHRTPFKEIHKKLALHCAICLSQFHMSRGHFCSLIKKAMLSNILGLCICRNLKLRIEADDRLEHMHMDMDNCVEIHKDCFIHVEGSWLFKDGFDTVRYLSLCLYRACVWSNMQQLRMLPFPVVSWWICMWSF